MKIIISLVVFLIFQACSFKKNELANQTQNGHEELYSEPESPDNDVDAGTKKIIIAATNDIGGAFGPQAIKVNDKHNKDRLHIEIGGVDYLSSYLRILREKYKSVVLLDAGDFLTADPEDYRFAHEFYSDLHYDAITPGLTDMSSRSGKGTNPVKKFAEDSKVPVLTSNLYELKTARGVEWKGTEQYHLKEINGIKIGIIGLIPDDISALTPVENRVGLYVESMLQSTLHQARRLRSMGAHIIVVLTHQGIDCGNSIAEASKLPLTKVNFEPEKDGICDLKSPLGTYLQRLPARLVDVVVAGRNHRKIANRINGISVISGFESARSFSYVEMTVEDKSGKVFPEKTVIHQPVMICREFFKETNDCYTEDPSINHKERIPAKFLGVQVEPDEEMKKKFSRFFDSVSVGLHDDTDLLKKYSADIIFNAGTSGFTHFVLLEIPGPELSRWLEQNYNEEESHLWAPSPFFRDENTLELNVAGAPLSFQRTYRVLTDLESLQKRVELRKYITTGNLVSLNQESWQGSMNADEVSVISSSHRQ